MRLPEPRLPALRGGPTLRWGVLAPGAIASAFATSLHGFSDQRITAVGSRTLDRAEAFARSHGIPTAYGSYEALVASSDVDIVYISSPHSFHRPLAELAIAHGKHVLIEKPIAPTAADAEAIAQSARAAGVFAMEAMWSRFQPWVDVADQLIADGALGDVAFVSAEVGRYFPFDPAGRLFEPSLAGGALLDVGIYAAWCALHFAGVPSLISAQGEFTRTGVDAQSTAVLRGTDGVHATISSTLLAFTPSQASVSGTSGRLTVDGRFPMPNPLSVYDADNRLVARYEDTTGLVGHDALVREASWAAIHVAQGLTEAPQHPLEASIAQLRVTDEIAKQLAASRG
ncbi:Gfo/Idh/MocA family oxidoreductase [Mycetocola sp. 2940]|uniref:Gfo/Idh/MocA family protein n=1 Tax=Mycetocola sp. 2940 TaxID=3156452 RepID=UPI0033982207